jgi:hypothetical protein
LEGANSSSLKTKKEKPFFLSEKITETQLSERAGEGQGSKRNK